MWFCEKHISEYNKKWDFFDGMSELEIENFMYDDIIGNGNPIGLTNASAKFCMSAVFS